MIFDVMLSAYISALNAYHDRSASSGQKEGVKRASFDGWDQALKFAEDALTTFRDAEIRRQEGAVDSANMSVLKGLRLLNNRYSLH